MRIKVGDKVQVIAGNYKGVTGTIQRIDPKKGRVVVSGVSLVKKHQKPQQTGGFSQAQGGIIEFEAPIDASNVMLVDPETGELTRVGIRREPIEGTNKSRRVRYAKNSGAVLD
ncbi:MAG: 50S ribosomal protein L24 [Anaerolineae bacterium]|jgi:large subunit ribosomal protein L24